MTSTADGRPLHDIGAETDQRLSPVITSTAPVGEEKRPDTGAFWVIERSDIPWGSKPAGVTLYRSKRAGETWTDDIYRAAQWATRKGAEVFWKSREASDSALRPRHETFGGLLDEPS